MAKHYKIVINVAYDDAHTVTPTSELISNVRRSVDRGLLTDKFIECVIKEWSVHVEGDLSD